MGTCPTCHNTFSNDMEFCPRDGARLTAAASETEVQLAWGLARRFRIVRRLGAGGMGTVFLAEQIAVGDRPVALKVLNRKLLDDPEFLLRFQNEAASTGRIRHPNVVTIYGFGQADDGTPYIAMEYLEGETLRHALNAREALPVAECAEILQQAARGLNAAHKLGIIHRDLKPDNIFLTYPDDVGAPLVGAPGRPQGPPLQRVVVKLVDFGIAKLRESPTRTLTGTVLGTPAYMSYEQASGMKSDELDARSDIYSLGVVTYEMLTGRLPFQSDTPVGYLRKHLQEAPPPFRAAKPDLPVLPQVESVVMKALTKDRNQRYGSVLEFAREFAEAGPAEAPRPTVATEPLPQKPYPSRRKWVVIAGYLIFLVAAMGVGVRYWPRLGLGPANEPPTAAGSAPPGLGQVQRRIEAPTAVAFTPFALERTLAGHRGGVDSVAFSPDGKLLASADWGHAIKVWGVSSGAFLQTLGVEEKDRYEEGDRPIVVDSVAFTRTGEPWPPESPRAVPLLIQSWSASGTWQPGR